MRRLMGCAGWGHPAFRGSFQFPVTRCPHAAFDGMCRVGHPAINSWQLATPLRTHQAELGGAVARGDGGAESRSGEAGAGLIAELGELLLEFVAFAFELHEA
jgi:hypothetical protein